MNPKLRIEELTNILNEANYNYYVLDNPTISDQEFDKYLRELIELEMEYHNLKKSKDFTVTLLFLTIYSKISLSSI